MLYLHDKSVRAVSAPQLFVYIQTLVNCAAFSLSFPCDLCEAESLSQNIVGVWWCHGTVFDNTSPFSVKQNVGSGFCSHCSPSELI